MYRENEYVEANVALNEDRKKKNGNGRRGKGRGEGDYVMELLLKMCFLEDWTSFPENERGIQSNGLKL